MGEVFVNSEISEVENLIPHMPSGLEDPLPYLEEKCSKQTAQRRYERQSLRKILHASRTKEGLDNERFEKRSGSGKENRGKISFSIGKVFIIRKRLRRYGSKENRNRSLRRRIFKVMMEIGQEERKAAKTTQDTSQDGEPCEEATSDKMPDNNNSLGSNKNFQHCFSRKTGIKASIK